MTALRRAAQGRLAEIYGERALPADDLARRMGIARTARESLAAQSPQTRAALQAYADGVNQWIEIVNQGALGRGAPEFFPFPDDIAYWQPADLLAVLKLFAASSSRQIPAEVLRAQLSLVAPERGRSGRKPGRAADAGLCFAVFGGPHLAHAAGPAEGWPYDLAGYLRPFTGSGRDRFRRRRAAHHRRAALAGQ